MNYDQITGIIRAVVPAVLAYFAGKGVIPDSSIPVITAAALAIAAAVWSVVNNTTTAKLTSAVADPGATAIAREIPPTPQVVAVANALKQDPKGAF